MFEGFRLTRTKGIHRRCVKAAAIFFGIFSHTAVLRYCMAETATPSTVDNMVLSKFVGSESHEREKDFFFLSRAGHVQTHAAAGRLGTA